MARFIAVLVLKVVIFKKLRSNKQCLKIQLFHI